MKGFKCDKFQHSDGWLRHWKERFKTVSCYELQILQQFIFQNVYAISFSLDDDECLQRLTAADVRNAIDTLMDLSLFVESDVHSSLMYPR